MNMQRSDLIAGTRNACGRDAVLICQCGADAEPFSCYCQECEEREFSDEHGDTA